MAVVWRPGFPGATCCAERDADRAGEASRCKRACRSDCALSLFPHGAVGREASDSRFLLGDPRDVAHNFVEGDGAGEAFEFLVAQTRVQRGSIHSPGGSA